MNKSEQTAATHHRRSIRLQGYDYSNTGSYFVTICTRNRDNLFGKIIDGEMQLNHAGKMVKAIWEEIPTHYDGINIDKFVIMSNHIHGIVIIVGAGPCACPDSILPETNGQPQGVAPTKLSLSDVIHRFKTMTTKRYTDGVKNQGWPPFSDKLWQRNYWEHIIRNEDDLNLIREYIHNNPAQWELDELYTETQTA